MLNMRLDSLSKNHGLNTPCATHGNNTSSECGAAHHCIRGNGTRLDMILAKRYRRRDACVYTHAYRVELSGLQRQRWALQQRAL